MEYYLSQFETKQIEKKRKGEMHFVCFGKKKTLMCTGFVLVVQISHALPSIRGMFIRRIMNYTCPA